MHAFKIEAFHSIPLKIRNNNTINQSILFHHQSYTHGKKKCEKNNAIGEIYAQLK